MEIIIELTDAEIDAVAGGNGGPVSFSFGSSASGTIVAVSGTLAIATTASSANLSGSLSLSAT